MIFLFTAQITPVDKNKQSNHYRKIERYRMKRKSPSFPPCCQLQFLIMLPSDFFHTILCLYLHKCISF